MSLTRLFTFMDHCIVRHWPVIKRSGFDWTANDHIYIGRARTNFRMSLQGRALYAAEADRIRNWAENRTRFSFTDAMEMYTENTWVSVFSLSVVCAFIILSSTGSSFPGTWLLTSHLPLEIIKLQIHLAIALTEGSNRNLQNYNLNRKVQHKWVIIFLPQVPCTSLQLLLGAKLF